MYTVMNRIPVPTAGAAAFEERFAATMRETLPPVAGLLGARLLRPQQEGGAYVAVMDFTSREAFTAWTRSDAFRAAHGPSTGGTGGGVETFETVAAVGA
ncbi:antibiotic biosynthesis monooxygenase family protein [Streptomyces sp. MS06]|uniref:antibiotic biosynthesis monooxygenase family protein n=1 Tax=Streptomyces sp. MS06 TaxID=3385974 RepID=UPI0039A10A51